jgi:hypothetical protein
VTSSKGTTVVMEPSQCEKWERGKMFGPFLRFIGSQREGSGGRRRGTVASSEWNFNAWCASFQGGEAMGWCRNLREEEEDDVGDLSPQQGWWHTARGDSVAGVGAAVEVAAGSIWRWGSSHGVEWAASATWARNELGRREEESKKKENKWIGLPGVIGPKIRLGR